MKEKLDNLVNKGYIYDYEIQDTELIIRYGLSSVGTTERVVDINGKDLKKALFESGEDIRVDIESSLVDDNDFFNSIEVIKSITYNDIIEYSKKLKTENFCVYVVKGEKND